MCLGTCKAWSTKTGFSLFTEITTDLTLAVWVQILWPLHVWKYFLWNPNFYELSNKQLHMYWNESRLSASPLGNCVCVWEQLRRFISQGALWRSNTVLNVFNVLRKQWSWGRGGDGRRVEGCTKRISQCSVTYSNWRTFRMNQTIKPAFLLPGIEGPASQLAHCKEHLSAGASTTRRWRRKGKEEC